MRWKPHVSTGRWVILAEVSLAEAYSAGAALREDALEAKAACHRPFPETNRTPSSRDPGNVRRKVDHGMSVAVVARARIWALRSVQLICYGDS
jgi:hypothetical protein